MTLGAFKLNGISRYIAPVATGGSIVTDNLQLHWNPLDAASYSGSGTAVNDLSGNATNGVLTGTVGYADNYWTFNGGSNNYIISNSIAGFNNNTNDISIGVWVKPAGAGSFITVGDSTTPNTGYNYTIAKYQDTLFQATVYGAGFNFITSSSSPVNNFYYVNISLDLAADTLRLYVNGTLQSTEINQGGHVTSANPMKLFLGANSSFGSGWFNGSMGAVHVYVGKALTDAESLQNFNATKASYGY